MAFVMKSLQVFNFFIYSFLIISCFSSYVSASRKLNEDNWRELLQGEWMVKFYAPWCPACNAMAPAWKELTELGARKMGTAMVDVSNSPGLSGRFLVTTLPTIYHVKDGAFRRYKGPRNAESMWAFVEKEGWKDVEPLPSWNGPDSLPMSFVAQFFKLSQVLRNLHTTLTEQYGLPYWGSYLVFALGTILIGAVLGLILVCIVDCLHPARARQQAAMAVAMAEEQRRKQRLDSKSDDELELINDDIVDDAEDSQNSDSEKNSPSDTEDETQPKAEGSGDDKPSEVRKRRPRKAD